MDSDSDTIIQAPTRKDAEGSLIETTLREDTDGTRDAIQEIFRELRSTPPPAVPPGSSAPSSGRFSAWTQLERRDSDMPTGLGLQLRRISSRWNERARTLPPMDPLSCVWCGFRGRLCYRELPGLPADPVSGVLEVVAQLGVMSRERASIGPGSAERSQVRDRVSKENLLASLERIFQSCFDDPPTLIDVASYIRRVLDPLLSKLPEQVSSRNRASRILQSVVSAAVDVSRGGEAWGSLTEYKGFVEVKDSETAVVTLRTGTGTSFALECDPVQLDEAELTEGSPFICRIITLGGNTVVQFQPERLLVPSDESVRKIQRDADRIFDDAGD